MGRRRAELSPVFSLSYDRLAFSRLALSLAGPPFMDRSQVHGMVMPAASGCWVLRSPLKFVKASREIQFLESAGNEWQTPDVLVTHVGT